MVKSLQINSLRRSNGAGFTLIELVIVIAVVGIVSGVFVKYLSEGTRMFEFVDGRKAVLMEARQALVRTTREIRQVRSSTDVVTAGTQTFSFYAVNDSLFTVSFSGTPGDNLEFQRGAVKGAIVTGVDSLAFTYYQEDGTPAVPVVSPNSTDIRRVHLFIRLARDGDRVSLRTGAFLRNVQ